MINKKYLIKQSTAKACSFAIITLMIIWSAFYLYLNGAFNKIQSTILFLLLCTFFLFTAFLFILQLYFQKNAALKNVNQKLNNTNKKYNIIKKKLSYVVNHDPSTNLLNRHAIENKLKKIIETATPCSLFSISFNNIHFIADTHGHEMVENIFIELVSRFQQILSKSSLIARVETDKLIICNFGTSSLSAQMLANQLNNVLTQEFLINEQNIVLNCSIGIAFFNDEIKNVSTFIHQANMALREARAQNKTQISTYHSKIQKKLNEIKNFEHALKYAIHNDDLTLNFQPHVDLRTQKIVGIEALVRWLDRKGNTVMLPSLIVKTAEKSGLMLQLAYWVMEKALKKYALLLDERCAPNMLTINASGLEFRDTSFAEYMHRTLKHYDIPASRVQIELSEKVFADDINNILAALQRLSELGISLAINDFGSGFLSLYYLKQLRISTLKIDPNFIENLHDSKDDMIICQTIIGMAKKLQIQVIAVGVENTKQQMILKSIGCHYIQGEHLYKALPFDILLTLLQKKREEQALERYQTANLSLFD